MVDDLVPGGEEVLGESSLQLEAGVVGSQVDAHAGSVSPVRTVLGLDGRRRRWAGALLGPADRVSFLDLADARAALAAADAAGAVAIGVDAPIGLPEAGSRAADLAARRALAGPGRAAGRVFAAPPLAVLRATTHAEAVRLARELTGRGVSVQTWNLRHAIASAAELAADGRVVEVHPELSFLAMAGRVLPRKKTGEGRAARLAALAAALPGLDRGTVPGHDDAVDALACAWSARRWAAGQAQVLGGEPDATGRPMRIVT